MSSGDSFTPSSGGDDELANGKDADALANALEAEQAKRVEADQDPSECPLGASWQTVSR